MNRTVLLGVVLISLTVIGLNVLTGWGMHGPWAGPGERNPSWMPHMGRGRGSGTGTAQAPVAGAPMVEVAMEDFGFRPAQIRAQAGQPVNLELTNRGRVLHDLTLPALGVHVEVQPGQETTVGLIAPRAGTYELFCSVPRHREAGMIGRLVIVR